MIARHHSKVQWIGGDSAAFSDFFYAQAESYYLCPPHLPPTQTGGRFLVNRESFMASHNFEKFMEVNDGA